MIAFSLFCNGTDDFVESVRAGGVKEIQEFLGIDVNQVLALKEYFNLFFVRANANGTLSEGWLKQVHRSAGGGDNFLFNASLFSPTDFKSLMKFSWNKLLCRTEGIGKDNHYSTGIFGSKFDSFKKQFLLIRDKESSWTSITNNGEQLYKLIYDTLSSLYNFK